MNWILETFIGMVLGISFMIHHEFQLDQGNRYDQVSNKSNDPFEEQI